MANKYELGLDKRPANDSALSPVAFLKRSAWIFPEKTAVIDDDGSFEYRQLYERCSRMAGSLRQLGVGAGEKVAVMCFNGHELLESHYSDPMIGTVLHALKTRQEAADLHLHIEQCQAPHMN